MKKSGVLIFSNLICIVMLIKFSYGQVTVPSIKQTNYIGYLNKATGTRETNYHRSELKSQIRLMEAVSKTRDEALNTIANSRCEEFKNKFYYMKKYIEIEQGDNDYWLAFCTLNKDYEYVLRTWTDSAGKVAEEAKYFNLYSGKQVLKADL